ncbi:MAG: tetratricopeptide repeat protein, partial [Candidatus Kariarchaeaceae archaeon]
MNELYSDSKFEEIILEAHKIDSKNINLEIEIIKARALRKLGRYKDALDTLSTIQFIPKDSIVSKINFYCIELDVLTHMGRYDEGMKRIERISKLLKEIDVPALPPEEKRVIAQTYNELARLNFFLSDYDSAINYLHQELSIAEELEDKEKIISSLQNIGSTYTSQGKYVESVEYFTNALSMAEETEIIHLIGHIEDNLGLVY